MKFATWVQADCTLDFTGLDRQPKGMHCPFPLFVGALLGSFLLGQTLLGDHHEGERQQPTQDTDEQSNGEGES